MLYRKYRPTTFKEIAGQEHVVQTLQGALRSGDIGHAYMFTGPRGTGKTSMARLFAKAVNCHKRKDGTIEPCNSCESCTAIAQSSSLDLIEIDAASNRGIDEIRTIRDAAHVASSSSTYKIFIIDEVHMLTPAAFNALLKVLEEPPAHIIFILATTEAHKVLDTIVSRVQRFDFKKIAAHDIAAKLKRVAKKESITIEPEALTMVIDYSAGGLRDAESALAKLIAFAGSNITAAATQQALGLVSIQTHEALLNAIMNKDAKTALSQLQTLHEQGTHIEQFTNQFIAYMRTQLIAAIDDQESMNPHTLSAIITAFTNAKQELKDAPIVTLPLELAIVTLCQE